MKSVCVTLDYIIFQSKEYACATELVCSEACALFILSNEVYATLILPWAMQA